VTDEDTGPVEDWDGDPVEEITEEQLAEILACWDQLVTPDMTAGARRVDLQDVEESASTAQPLDVYGFGSDPTVEEEPPDGLFAPYRADDPDITPLGRLLYGIEDDPH
jgi:hypothetical protein